MKFKKINWGMIGTGDVTEKKSGPAFNKIENSRLVAVGNRTSEKARNYAERHKIDRWYEDPMDVITDSEVNAVYIATPPGSHLEYALKVIEAGKAVYIEKPMARTYEECVLINQAASKKGVPVYVAYYRRSLPYFLKVKEILDSKSIGKLINVTAKQYFPTREEDHDRNNIPWRVVPEISGGGYFHDMGCHGLDILFYLFGDPENVLGSRANRGGLYTPEDTITALITLPGNLLLSGSWSFITPPEFQQDIIEVTGESGRLNFSVFSFEPISLEADGKKQLFMIENPEHIQMPFIESIVSELTGKGKSPSTGLSGTVTSRVMEEILQ